MSLCTKITPLSADVGINQSLWEVKRERKINFMRAEYSLQVAARVRLRIEGQNRTKQMTVIQNTM
jgi:hypothetical protein